MMKMLKILRREESLARQLYESLVKRKLLLIMCVLLSLAMLFIVDIITGPAWLSLRDVFSAIFFPRSTDRQTYVIIWVMRLPIAVTALLVGASLGIAGAEMQTILDNPMADPYTLGISSAASFGASLAIVTGKSVAGMIGNSMSLYAALVPVNAFIFSLISSLLIYFIASLKKGAAEIIILAGITIGFLFSSLTSILQYMASESELQGIARWSYGSLIEADWKTVGVIFCVLAATLPVLVLDAWKLTALKLGDSKLKSMGVDVDRLRLKVLIIVSIIVATAVCFVGTIGFIGLVAPHLARSFVGEDQRFYLPFSALSGALILSFASIVSKIIVPGAIIEVGIITCIIGIPFLLSIIMRGKRQY